MNKKDLGLALQVGSLFMPVICEGAGGAIGVKLLSPLIGRTVGKAIGQGVVTGGLTGLVEGTGRGLYENQNPLKTGLIDMTAGSIMGGSLGHLGANISKGFNDKSLSNFLVKGRRDKHNLKQLGKKYYQNYLQERVVNTPMGKAKFDAVGVREDWRQNPKYMKNYPTLIDDINKSEYVRPELPIHSHKEENISLFHRLRNEDKDFLFAQTPKGLKYYKTVGVDKNIVPEGIPVETVATDTNNILTDLARNFKTKLFDYLIKK